MTRARRLFMMGYDGMNYQLLRRFAKEGCLPTFQSLLNRGSLNRLLCAIPAWTPFCAHIGHRYTSKESLHISR